MKKPYSLSILLLLILGAGCRQYAYYQSPLQANDHPYKAIPLRSDSLKAATYFSGHFMIGGANDKFRDNLFNFNFDLHRAHNLGSFQAWYEAQFTLGGYDVKPHQVSQYNSATFNVSAINANAGNKFYGAWGAAGGINVVVPFREGGEWRALGTELYYNNEFGDYLRFRQKLPPGTVNNITRNRDYWSMGFFTEVIGKMRNSHALGYKMGFVAALKELKKDNEAGHDFTPGYFSQTFHYTWQRSTVSLGWNAGSYSMNLQMGVNVRLGK